jgi:hypothetical protein
VPPVQARSVRIVVGLEPRRDNEDAMREVVCLSATLETVDAVDEAMRGVGV